MTGISSNKSLLNKQKEIEDGLLDNIEAAVSKLIKEQHIKAKKIDTKLDDKIDKKVEQVTRLVTSHIINGNDVKLLSLPETNEEASEKKNEELKSEIQQVSSDVRNKLKLLPENEMKKLQDKYGNIENETE